MEETLFFIQKHKSNARKIVGIFVVAFALMFGFYSFVFANEVPKPKKSRVMQESWHEAIHYKASEVAYDCANWSIKQNLEGFVGSPYYDINAWREGYGTLSICETYNYNFDDKMNCVSKRTITKKEAKMALEMAYYDLVVLVLKQNNGLIHLKENQICAIVDLTFNSGLERTKRTNTYKAISKGIKGKRLEAIWLENQPTKGALRRAKEQVGLFNGGF